MKALILAAGYATRLYPLTKEFPKPLLEVGARPMIDYIVDKLCAIDDCDEIFVVTNSKFISNFTQWARGRSGFEKKITLVDDLTSDLDDRRGAIGDMHFAIEACAISDDLLVIGGDNLFEDPLHEFLALARSKSPMPTIGVYDIEKLDQASQYGIVRVDEHAIIVDFQEKPSVPQSTLVAMCLYYFPGEKLRLVGQYLGTKVDKHDAVGYYIDWLTKHEKVQAFIFKGPWYDIGNPEFYNKAQDHYKKRD
jgi:glucose-1-phosphate thymidylyltransferase